jgi:hypothetical protein
MFNLQDHHPRNTNTAGHDPVYASQNTNFQLHRQWTSDSRDDHQSHRGYDHGEGALSHPVFVLRRIFQNKKLLILIGVLLIVVLGLAVTAVFYFLPLFGKLPGFVDVSNWQGLVDQGMLMLQKILSGAKSA